MREDAIIKKAYHFPGLTVLVPNQNSHDFDIIPLNLPDEIPDDIPEITENFTLIRYIANLALFRSDHLEAGNYEEPVQEFNPPIEFRVNYSLSDVFESHCEIQRLKLAYWDLEKWVIISDPSHEYQILLPSTAQVAEAKIWSWVGDPALAWGK